MVLRLRSDVQASALQRQAEAEGCFFSVLHRGHEEGGLLFIKWVDGRDVGLFCERTVGDTRRWAQRGGLPMAEAEANQILESERSFDPDLWVIEVEGRLETAERLLDPIED